MNNTRGQQVRFKSYTLILPTYNEEARVKRVVEYYKSFAKLIVVDNFSTDRTVEIAEGLGVEVVRHKNNGSTQTSEWFKFVASIVEAEYIGFLSCSEFFPQNLLEKFNKVAEDKIYDMVSCKRRCYISGREIPLRYRQSSVDRLIRISGLDLDKIAIHKVYSFLGGGQILDLSKDSSCDVIHVREVDAVSNLKNYINYALSEAKQYEDAKKSFSLPALFLRQLKEVVRLFTIPPYRWNGIVFREIWVRMVMHTVTYWVCWESKNDDTLEASRKKSEELWERLVSESPVNKPANKKDE